MGSIFKKQEPPKRDPRLDAELEAARKREEDRKKQAEAAQKEKVAREKGKALPASRWCRGCN